MRLKADWNLRRQQDSGVVDDSQDGIMWNEDSPDFRDDLFEDPLVTADQVISELDEFLDVSSINDD